MAKTKTKARGAPTPRLRAAARRGVAAPKVVVDRALKARWQDSLARYRTARTAETAGWDDRYEALGEILDGDPPYYLAGGYETARAFLAAEAPDQDERTVRTYIRVARWFEPEDEARHGVTKLDALLTYLEAAAGAPLAPAKLNLTKQRVRVPDGKTTRAVAFAEATADDLRRATRGVRGAAHGGPTAPPLVKALRQALAAAKLSAIGVRLRGGRIDLSGIAPAQLAALGKALAKLKLPPS